MKDEDLPMAIFGRVRRNLVCYSAFIAASSNDDSAHTRSDSCCDSDRDGSGRHKHLPGQALRADNQAGGRERGMTIL